MILWLDRFLQKVIRTYRKAVFREKIRCPHRDFTLVGHVHLINRNISLGRDVTIYPDVMFFGDGQIEIGDHVSIGNGTVIYASKSAGVHIGNDTQIAAQCYIIDTDHGIQKGTLMREQENTCEPVHIGSDVWIAANVSVLKGAKICDGAVVGAKALVKGEIPENAIAVGIPAKPIRYRQ